MPSARASWGFLPLSLWLACAVGPAFGSAVCSRSRAAGLKLAWRRSRCGITSSGGKVANENNINKTHWLIIGLPLFAAYGLPATGLVLPTDGAAAFLLAMPSHRRRGALESFALRQVSRRQPAAARPLEQSNETPPRSRSSSARRTSAPTLASPAAKKGFEYLNDLFVKRHRKILWQASKRVAGVCLLLVLGVLLLFYWNPEVKPAVNGALLSYLPYFVFILYAINRGSSFTKALFLNCDHSLLAYTFLPAKRRCAQAFLHSAQGDRQGQFACPPQSLALACRCFYTPQAVRTTPGITPCSFVPY